MNQVETLNNYNGALQYPIGSGFNASSTAADVIKGIELRGKTAIVTGGYAGIGLETVRTLAEAGAEIWVPARDVAKAQKNLKGIAGVRVKAMDLMDPITIDLFAAEFLESGKPLHILVNNAGIMWAPLRRDSRGFESQLSTHFQLTARLWSALKKAGTARVVMVSSYGHQMSPFNFEDPNFTNREYHTLQGYGQSKTANNLFAVELDRRAAAFGVRAYSLHPGSVYGTDLGREEPIELFKQLGTHDVNGKIFPEVITKLKTIPQGAATTVWCATSPMLDEIGGVYCEDCDIAQVDKGDVTPRYDDPSTQRGVQRYAVEGTNAQRLWTVTEEMTGMSFGVE